MSFCIKCIFCFLWFVIEYSHSQVTGYGIEESNQPNTYNDRCHNSDNIFQGLWPVATDWLYAGLL